MPTPLDRQHFRLNIIFTPAIVRNGDMFLFVVVSRQTKKALLCDLCVSAVKCPNPYLR